MSTRFIKRKIKCFYGWQSFAICKVQKKKRRYEGAMAFAKPNSTHVSAPQSFFNLQCFYKQYIVLQVNVLVQVCFQVFQLFI